MLFDSSNEEIAALVKAAQEGGESAQSAWVLAIGTTDCSKRSANAAHISKPCFHDATGISLMNRSRQRPQNKTNERAVARYHRQLQRLNKPKDPWRERVAIEAARVGSRKNSPCVGY
jgi:hypothetical protein